MDVHVRKCWDCGNVAEHLDSVVPHVLCKECGSRDTRRVKQQIARTLVDTEFVASVEDELGMGSNAWDMVDPIRICKAVLKVAKAKGGER